MKKLIFILSVLCCTSLITAQTTNTFPTSGDVGIGTLSPSDPLTISINGSYATLRLLRTGSSIADFRIRSGYGQLEFFGGSAIRMVIEENGNVGIGTDSPTHKLAVNGFIKAQGSDGRLMLENSAANTSIYLRNSGTSSQRKFEILYGTQAKFAMDNDGNVGIGTTSPTSSLHILTTNSSGMKFSRSGANDYGFEIGGANFGLYNYTTSEYKWRTNNGNVLIAETGGNVGIGTTSPSSLLHLDSDVNTALTIEAGPNLTSNLKLLEQGTGDVGAYLLYDGLNNRFGVLVGNNPPVERLSILRDNGNVGIGTTSPGHKLQVQSANNNFIRSKSTATNSIAGVAVSNDAKEWIIRTYGDDFFQIRDVSNNAQRLVIDPSDGNVGIGTSSPSEKLEVSGNILIQGDIESKKIKVTATPGNWPDYVFASNYQLTPLSQVEDFIKKNQHLPEVPSAQEIAEKGQDLGDIQAILLKKMEEMTLHMIEQQKRQNASEAKQRKLEKEIELLKNENKQLKLVMGNKDN